MNASEYVLKLLLEGRHEEARALARQIIAMYREDPTCSMQPADGTCHRCGHIFTDVDCQHEVMDKIMCDRCYLDLGGK